MFMDGSPKETETTTQQQPVARPETGNEGEVECPFVLKHGPSCPHCGALPTSVNIDEQGRYGHCDDCGGRFSIRRDRKKR